MVYQSDNYWISYANDLSLVPYSVKRNPRVGAVLIDRSGLKIAEGFHEGYGTDHAEQVAIKIAGKKAKGCTIYVSLSPCNHIGKTPSCSQLIVDSGISKVVYSNKDPNPLSHQSTEFLNKNGVEVQYLKSNNRYSRVNHRWFKSFELQRPYVTAKIALSLDGKIHDGINKKQRLTGKESELEVHQIRNGCDAIVTGTETILVDNPELNVRLPKKLQNDKQPIKCVVGDREIPENYRIRMNRTNTLFIKRAHPKIILDQLFQNDCHTVLLESGPKLLTEFLNSGLVDELILYLSPLILGKGKRFLDEIVNPIRDESWQIGNVGLVGEDLRIQIQIR